MYVYFDENGVLKEIITERQFRVGDSKRDKIYVYWDGEHSPLSAWVKYLLPTGVYTNETTFSTTKVGKELPSKPLRNLKYFSYDHTYETLSGARAGYEFYEITIPDEVLDSYSAENDDRVVPTENNLVIARIRFVLNEGSEVAEEVDNDDVVESLGALPFCVEENIGIITDDSINVSQYNYILKLISDFQEGSQVGYVLLPSSFSGVLTSDELVETEKTFACLKYRNRLYLKAYEDNNAMYFRLVEGLEGTNNDYIVFDKIIVDRSSGSWELEQETLNTITESDINALF